MKGPMKEVCHARIRVFVFPVDDRGIYADVRTGAISINSTTEKSSSNRYYGSRRPQKKTQAQSTGSQCRDFHRHATATARINTINKFAFRRSRREEVVDTTCGALITSNLWRKLCSPEMTLTRISIAHLGKYSTKWYS